MENNPLECESKLEHTSLISEASRVVRYSVAALGGYLVAHGYMEAATVEMIAGVAVTATPLIVGMILAHVRRKQTKQVIQHFKRQPPSPSDGKPEGE